MGSISNIDLSRRAFWVQYHTLTDPEGPIGFSSMLCLRSKGVLLGLVPYFD